MSKKTMQYTIKNVPISIDRILKKKAKKRGVSLNALLLSFLKNEAQREDDLLRQKKIDVHGTHDHDWEEFTQLL